jgi:tetratricopeptide (TPR) repeat protein
MNPEPAKGKRFNVALSFPGEHRDFVAKVADCLAKTLAPETILYDKFHEADFARINLNVYLPNLYRTESELIAVFLCKDYSKKKWCRLEWRHISNLICSIDEEERIMLLNFDHVGEIPELGILSGDGWVDIGTRSPEEIAALILKRLGGKAKIAAVEPAKPVASLSSLNQLPPLPAKFTGRGEVLEKLEKELAADRVVGAAISGVLTNLQGAPGVGKTALATVLAHRLKDRYPDAQLYQNLRGAGADIHGQHSGTMLKPVAPADAMQSIIHAFHPEAKLPENEAELSATYRSVLAKAGRVLLFLDNAADGNQVCPLLPPPNCLLLVTSRQQLNLDELVEHHLDYLSPEESQELLLKLAPKLKGYEQEAAKLCGNLPLALKTVAGMVKSQSIVKPSEILARLRSKQDKLASVDAAFQVSYEVLAKESQKRWALLSVFLTGFDLPAAAAVWNEGVIGPSQRAFMQVLVNASLVEWNEVSGRFRLHDLVRQFCDGKLAAAERTAAMLRYAAHYRDVGDEAKQLYLKGGENVRHGLALFDRERTHIEAAFAFLADKISLPSGRDALPRVHAEPQLGPTETDAATLLVSLVDAVAYTSNLRFHPHQRIRWLEAQRDAARIIKNRHAEGAAIGNLGLAYADLGDAHKAIEFYEQRLVAREIGDRRGEGATLGNLGNAYAALGDTRKAIEFHEQALVIMREIGDRRAEDSILGNLGTAYAALGDARKAIEYHEQALVIDREIGDRRGEGSDLGNLGTAYAKLGDARKAIEFYEQALVIAREIGDRYGEGNALGNLGLAYRQLGDTHRAVEFHEQALVIAREIGDRLGEGQDLGNLGNAYADLGDARKAIEFYEQRLVIAREIGDRRGEGNALWNSALALDKLGKRAQAIPRAEAALKIREAIEDPNAAKVRTALAEWRGQA